MSGGHWTVRWPDGTEERLFSPSAVVAEMFEAGASYPLCQFVQRSQIALERAWHAAERRHDGSAAITQPQGIETRARQFADLLDARVQCLRLEF